MPGPDAEVLSEEEERERRRRRPPEGRRDRDGHGLGPGQVPRPPPGPPPPELPNSSLSPLLSGAGGPGGRPGPTPPPPPPGRRGPGQQERLAQLRRDLETAKGQMATALARLEAPGKALDAAVAADARRAAQEVIMPAVAAGLAADLEADAAARIEGRNLLGFGGENKYRRHLKDKADALLKDDVHLPGVSGGEKARRFVALHMKANNEAITKEARNRTMPDIYRRVARQSVLDAVPANPEVTKLVSAEIPALESAARQRAEAGLGDKLKTNRTALEEARLKDTDARTALDLVAPTTVSEALERARQGAQRLGSAEAGFGASDVDALQAEMRQASDAVAQERAPKVLERAKATFKAASWYQRANPLREKLLTAGAEQSLQTTSTQIKGHSGEALKGTYETVAGEGLNSKLAIIGKAIDGQVSNAGDRTQIDLTVLIPVEPSSAVKVGFHFRGQAERTDDETTKLRLIAAFQGAASVPGAKAAAEAGRSLEAESRGGGAGCMDLISLAYYRDFRQSSAIPASFTDYLWGMEGRSGLTAYEEAEAWAEAQEEKMHPGDSVMLGYTGAILGQMGNSLLQSELQGEMRHTSGTRYTKASIEERRTKLKNNHKDLRRNRFGGLYRPQRDLGQKFSSKEVLLQGYIGNLAGSVRGRMDTYDGEPTQYTVEVIGGGQAPASLFGNPVQLGAQVANWAQDAQKLFLKAMRYATEQQEEVDPRTGQRRTNPNAQGGMGVIFSGGESMAAAGEAAREKWVQGATAPSSQGTSLLGGALGYLSLASIQLRFLVQKAESVTVTVSLDKGTTISAELLGTAAGRYSSAERIFPAVIYRSGAPAGQKLSLGKNRAMTEWANHQRATAPPP